MGIRVVLDERVGWIRTFDDAENASVQDGVLWITKSVELDIVVFDTAFPLHRVVYWEHYTGLALDLKPVQAPITASVVTEADQQIRNAARKLVVGQKVPRERRRIECKNGKI